MEKTIENQDILEMLNHIEHPEIAVSLVELGMILDVEVDGSTANVAMALPMPNIPQPVQNALIQCVDEPLTDVGLEAKVHFFEMSEEYKQDFFKMAKANWKGSI